MGSTISALYIIGNKALSCNVGDSKTFLIRGENISQLSFDHNETAVKIRDGLLSEEEAKKDPGFHALTQYLGVSRDDLIIEPFFSKTIRIMSGDVFLLCRRW